MILPFYLVNRMKNCNVIKCYDFRNQAAKEMIEKTGQRSVPVLDIDGNIVIGFDKNKIDELLNIG